MLMVVANNRIEMPVPGWPGHSTGLAPEDEACSSGLKNEPTKNCQKGKCGVLVILRNSSSLLEPYFLCWAVAKSSCQAVVEDVKCSFRGQDEKSQLNPSACVSFQTL